MPDSAQLRFKRVLLKVSGEALMGKGSYGIDPVTANRIANEIKTVTDLGAEVCLVIGGGNIFRGISGAAAGLERHRRLHGHAGDRDERAGHAERAGGYRRADPGAVGNPDVDHLRALHPPPGVRHMEKGRWSSSRPEPAIPSSPPIPPPPCARPK
jgi:hypothetical protein